MTIGDETPERPVVARHEGDARLAECAAALADALNELGAAKAAGDRARQNRARVALARLRQRYEWLVPRVEAAS